MIEIDYLGRLGNQMFQLMAATILSEKTGMPISNPLDNKIIRCEKTGKAETYSKAYISDDEYMDIVEGGSYERDKSYIISSYCQSERYVDLFSKNRHLLIDTEEEDEEDNGFFATRVFVHVRLGDMVEGKNIPFEYFDAALGQMKFEDGGYIASDTMSHEIVRSLIEKYELVPFADTPENTIIWGSKFKKKVLSHGTFSWWIGFLGSQKNVVFPNTEKHAKWHGNIFVVDGWKIQEY